jgi:hypothetical protein
MFNLERPSNLKAMNSDNSSQGIAWKYDAFRLSHLTSSRSLLADMHVNLRSFNDWIIYEWLLQ